MPTPSSPTSPNWPKLLDIALGLLEDAGFLRFATFGGGTALSLALEHRLSWDVDLFLPDPQYLGYLLPERNALVKDLLERVAGDYQEDATYLKLQMPEGQIDFIVAPKLTASDDSRRTFGRFELAVESPAEILAKKLRFRGGIYLKTRDVFDLLATQTFAPDKFQEAMAIEFDRAATALQLRTIANTYPEDVLGNVTPTDRGKALVGISPLTLLPFIEPS